MTPDAHSADSRHGNPRGDVVIVTGRESDEERYHRQQIEADAQEAVERPLADEMARRHHELLHRRGSAYYRWEDMQASYRREHRNTMQWVVNLVGVDEIRAALS